MIHVIAAIIFSKDKILIARRAPHKDQPGLWEFPGGKIEEGENDESCLKREIFEELSLNISVSKHLTSSMFEHSEKTIHIRFYICQLVSGEPSLSDHDQIEWIFPHQLDNFEFAPADIEAVTALKAFLK